MMNWNDYLVLSEKTLSTEFHTTDIINRILHGVMGLCTELGELDDCLSAKMVDRTNLKEEIGDAYWYLAILYRDTRSSQRTEVLDGEEGVPDEFITKELLKSSLILLDMLKKRLYYNKDLDMVVFYSQVNHIDYYLQCLGLNYGLMTSDILEVNINKLRARYGDKFSSEKAINRDLDQERNILNQ